MKPRAEILPTHTAALFATAVSRAVELLRAGELVALPTETVYGLAANALDAKAVARIFEVKGRPANNPLIVHVASVAMARRCVSEWPDLVERLAKAFWPGPLTMVLPRSSELPDIVTASGPTVGVRWSSHPFIQAVIRECGFPLAAPSANLSSQVSPTKALHVQNSLGNKIGLIVDGGQSQVGIESSVLDVTVAPPRLLRPGMIQSESLVAVTGDLMVGADRSAASLRSPGLLRKHYSPNAKLVICSWQDETDLRSQISNCGFAIADVHIIAHTRIPISGAFGRVSVIPHDADAFGRAIYAELHSCDDTGARLIVVEKLPDTPEWQAIADRLERASA